MSSPIISVRVTAAMYEEVTRIAGANCRSLSDTCRALIENAVVSRAEETTVSQMQLVERRLHHIEKRFSAFLVKIARSSARTEYFAETILLESAGTDEQGLRLRQHFQDEAELYAIRLLQAKGKGVPALTEEQEEE